MNLKVIDIEFSICKVEDYSLVDLNEEFVFTGRTDEELSLISTCWADNGIGIFTISTFNTDYILTKDGDFSEAIEVLERAGYAII